MNKITKALLEAKFPTLNVDNLLEIINATPNPIVATEVLCGLYEEIDISSYKKDSHSEVDRMLLSFDKYREEVTYSYFKRQFKEIYVLRTKVSEATFETPDVKGYYKSEKAKALNITEEEFDAQYVKVIVYGDIETTARTSKMSLSNWIID